MVSRRLAVGLAGLALSILSACGGATVTSDPDRPTPTIEATAYSKGDGVETWDLTGTPSREAFGIEGDSSTGNYETKKPRTVRILLPGHTVELQAVLISFYNTGTDFTFGIRSPYLTADELTATFRDVLGQLDLDVSLADEFAQKVAAAPSDQSEAIEVGVGFDGGTQSGDWSVGPAVTFTPMADGGSMTFSGSHSAS